MDRIDDLRCPGCGAIAWLWQRNELMDDLANPGQDYPYTRQVTIRLAEDETLELAQSFDDLDTYDPDEISLGEHEAVCEECGEEAEAELVYELARRAPVLVGEGTEGRATL